MLEPVYPRKRARGRDSFHLCGAHGREPDGDDDDDDDGAAVACVCLIPVSGEPFSPVLASVSARPLARLR